MILRHMMSVPILYVLILAPLEHHKTQGQAHPISRYLFLYIALRYYLYSIVSTDMALRKLGPSFSYSTMRTFLSQATFKTPPTDIQRDSPQVVAHG